jgi:large subunit ribosomal protein L25
VLHTEAGHNALINLDVAGTSHLTIVKSLQRHPVRNEVVHVDFIVVSRDEVVTVEVPVVLHGEAKAVAQGGGTVEQNLFSLTMQAKPGDIPSEISVDISGLGIGDTIRVADLQLPLGSSTEVDGEEPVVIGQMSHTAEEVEAADDAVAEAAAEAAEEEAEGEGAGESGDDESAAGSGDEGAAE